MNIKAMPQSLLLDCISLVYKTSPVLMHSRNCFQFCLMFDCDYRLEMLFFHEMKFSDSLVYEHSWLLTLIPGLSSLLTALDGSGWDMIGVTAIMCYVSLLVCHFALSDFNLAPVRRSGTNTACRSIPPVLHNKDQLCHIISVPTKTWKWVCVCVWWPPTGGIFSHLLQLWLASAHPPHGYSATTPSSSGRQLH